MLPAISKKSAIKTFQVTSGALRVIDPCYDADVWCCGTLTDVRNGTWNAHVGYRHDANLTFQLRKRIDEATAEIDAAREGDAGMGMRAYWGHERARLQKELSEFAGEIVYLHIAYADANSSVEFDVDHYAMEDIIVFITQQDESEPTLDDLQPLKKLPAHSPHVTARNSRKRMRSTGYRPVIL